MIQIVVLAIVQGATEFLPISSSAHLILVPVISGWKDQGLAFDVAVHIGTLIAVIFYFRQQLIAMAMAWIGSLSGRGLSVDGRLAWLVIAATLPVVVAGASGKDLIEQYLRSALVIAAATILFGLLLWWADVFGKRQRDESELTWRDALIIGLAQVIALIPGVSRSGITITAGLVVGLTRAAAARFSFLLSIPTIAGSGVFLSKELLEQTTPVDWTGLLLAAVLAALSAYFCIHYFLQLLERVGMLPFVIYRLLLGGLLLILFW